MSTQKKFEKLPSFIIPKHYNIHLVPNLEIFTFSGRVEINIEIKAETGEIVLNSFNLDFDTVKLKSDRADYAPTTTVFLLDEEKAKIMFSPTLLPGNYSLHIAYIGKLEDNMRGFYRSKYVDDKGKEFYSAVTQFAPSDARRCFPCWDEPAIKATFDITLTVKKDLVALANTSIRSTTSTNNQVTYLFNTTPKMSTYLAAFIVGHFDYVEKTSSGGVLIRVYTPLGKSEQGQFALDVAAKVLPYYEEYFKIPYPLPKLDLIAVSGLSYGAMENWGLVTYREERLLIDPKNSSAVNKQVVTLIVAHELAHQWFGNLVTMKWWTDLWLNEGYATFLQFFCGDHICPEYNLWSQFVNTYFLAALELDSLKNSHPIEVAVNNPSEINEIFDFITYNKGASIIRMLVDFIGNDTFREGMSFYLTRYQYSNTSTNDLWMALEEASEQPVAKIMSTWTNQMGFPLIKVDTSITTNGLKVKLTQTKFTADGSQAAKDYLWMVPISISSSLNPNKIVTKFLLTTPCAEVDIPDLKSADWIKINPGIVGFYRTQYTSDMLDKFEHSIRNNILPSLDRLGLLEDMFALVKAGYLQTETLLKFLKVYENETDSNVWMSIINILNKLTTIIAYTDSKELFSEYRKKLVQKIYQKMGWDASPNDTHIDTLLRCKVLEHFGLLQDNHMISEANKRFQKHVSAEQPLPADIRVACYSTVTYHGSEEKFETLLRLYKSTDLNEEKTRISQGLGSTCSTKSLRKLLQFAFSDDVKSQDSVLVLLAAAQNTEGRNLTWEFLKENWSTVTNRYSGTPLGQRLIKDVLKDFATTEKQDDVKAFFSENKSEWIKTGVQQVLESIAVNIAWIKRDSQSIQKYLNA